MQVSLTYKLIVIGALISLLAVIGYDYLPEKRLVIFPAHNVEAYLFTDKNSRAVWIDETTMHWQCDVREGADFLTCGFVMPVGGSLAGVDLTMYTQMVLKLNVDSAEKRVRVYLRNWDEGLSTADDETQKFNYVLIPKRDLQEEITVDMRRFAVAEWWLHQFDVPQEHSYPTFDSVRSFGVEIGVPPTPGIHTLQLEKLEFVGSYVAAEHWYRSILIFWIAALVPFGTVRYIQMKKRLAVERRQLERLASYSNQLKEEGDKFKEMSTVDNLTGVLNRHGFEAALSELMKALTENQQIGLMIIDLDHFKKINDTHGHDVGDEVLKTIAEMLKHNIRGSDRLARWGGEEFIILCPHIHPPGAFVLAEKLRQAVASAQFSSLPGLTVTASIGLGCFNAEESFENVFKRIDAALYQAKERGRNCTVQVD